LRQQQQLVDGLDIRLLRIMRNVLAARQRELGVQWRHLQAQNPERRLLFFQQRYSGLPERLRHAWHHHQQRRAEHLAATGRQLNAVSPLATMQRGYAVLRGAEHGKVITRATQLARGDRILALLADGRAHLRVDKVEHDVEHTPDKDKDG
jgi:exodeoxyribonuclease VII large subunit